MLLPFVLVVLPGLPVRGLIPSYVWYPGKSLLLGLSAMYVGFNELVGGAAGGLLIRPAPSLDDLLYNNTIISIQ